MFYFKKLQFNKSINRTLQQENDFRLCDQFCCKAGYFNRIRLDIVNG